MIILQQDINLKTNADSNRINRTNKRRDSYSNPDNIPIEFRQKYTFGLPIDYKNENKLVVNKKPNASAKYYVIDNLDKVSIRMDMTNEELALAKFYARVLQYDIRDL